MHFLSYDVASFGVYFNHGGGLFYSDACVQALGRFTVLSSVRRKQSCTQVSIGLFIYIHNCALQYFLDVYKYIQIISSLRRYGVGALCGLLEGLHSHIIE